MKWLVITAAAVALSTAADRAGLVIEHASVTPRASHHELYRAAAKPDISGTWLFQLEDAVTGRRVHNASIHAYAWMPMENRAMTAHVRATGIGAGVYRTDGVKLDRTGWWNVKLVIASSIGTDSVAFNVTVR